MSEDTRGRGPKSGASYPESEEVLSTRERAVRLGALPLPLRAHRTTIGLLDDFLVVRSKIAFENGVRRERVSRAFCIFFPRILHRAHSTSKICVYVGLTLSTSDLRRNSVHGDALFYVKYEAYY